MATSMGGTLTCSRPACGSLGTQPFHVRGSAHFDASSRPSSTWQHHLASIRSPWRHCLVTPAMISHQHQSENQLWCKSAERQVGMPHHETLDDFHSNGNDTETVPQCNYPVC
eukprot:52140-Amphidinium_carterae.2